MRKYEEKTKHFVFPNSNIRQLRAHGEKKEEEDETKIKSNKWMKNQLAGPFRELINVCIAYELFNIFVKTLCCLITLPADGKSFFFFRGNVQQKQLLLLPKQHNRMNWTISFCCFYIHLFFVFRLPEHWALNIASI